MRDHFCNFCMNCVKFLQKYESKICRRYNLIYTNCKIIHDGIIVTRLSASLRSAADRRNLQNTVTEFPDYRLKMISKVPRKPFSSPTPFLFFSLRETVKYSQTEFHLNPTGIFQ